jgi:hypothetical protein
VTYGICCGGVETLDFAHSDVVLELVDCCGEIALCIFVRMEVGQRDY